MRSAPPSEPSCDKTPATTLRIITRSASSALCEAPHKAEFERDLIRARTGEGRERAKARGVKMGRPHKLTDHQKREAIKRRDTGNETSHNHALRIIRLVRSSA